MRLQLQVLLQALLDILTYELNLPHAGIEQDDEDDALERYTDALAYIAKYPSLLKRWKTVDKQLWLEELKKVQDDLS